MVEHLTNRGHSVETDSAFEAIYMINRNIKKTADSRLFSIDEAFVIHLDSFKPYIPKYYSNSSTQFMLINSSFLRSLSFCYRLY